MKKTILTVVTAFLLSFSFLSSFEIKRDYNNSQKIELNIPYLESDVKLLEDISTKDGYSKTLYSVEETNHISFSIEKAQFEKEIPKSYFQRIWNIKSLLFPDLEYKNSLQLMKDLRAASKKAHPYSTWKLISAVDENDVIYEKKILDLGTHQKAQELTRLINTKSGFFIVSYKIQDDHFTKDEYDCFYTSLKEMNC